MSKCKSVCTSKSIQKKSILDDIVLKDLTWQSTGAQSLHKWMCKCCPSQILILCPKFFCKTHYLPPDQAICQKSCSRRATLRKVASASLSTWLDSKAAVATCSRSATK